GKPITIQGPYGSGKTQLLYHLFKFTYEKGGIGIYTHLEKIIPPQKMGPSEYADYLKELMNEEVNLLMENNSKLLDGRVKDFAVSHINQVEGISKVVLFVDEIEQQYRLLDEMVETDDHSPMREVIARVNKGEAGFFLVLAFAPVSFYEFSKGEAQTRRYLPVLLPIVEAKVSREYFGEIGNLIWWMGRGRFGWMLRIKDILEANILDINKISKKELQDICRNIGPIGGVDALEFEMIEKISDFNNFRDFIIHLEPKEKGGEIYAGSLQVVKKCLIYNQGQILEILESALRESKVSKVIDISYYLSIILDAISTSDGGIPLFIDPNDWKELLTMTEEVILEFEGEDKLPSEELKLLQDNILDFSFNVRKNAENTGRLIEGFCISPSFLHTLFPFPTSSPNLIPSKKIEEQRENLADQTYLGREEDNGTSIFFFLNADKIRCFLTQEIKNYLNETKTLILVNLGSKEDINKTKIAQWLERQGRLKVINTPRILSDFIVSFFYWMRNEKGESLPIANFFEKLTESQLVSEKNKARKIAYYSSRISEYIRNELPRKFSPRFILRDKTGFEEFRAGRVGFVPEVIGFSFVESRNDWEVIYKFRNEFEHSQFIRKQSTDKKQVYQQLLKSL
ncbi:MAG: ATP-binding protein, partial [Candidatus Aenigmarchaeota archaeon]|nr:ATP-binding protein [Candidatus Aenigmarchaeota archaeon]